MRPLLLRILPPRLRTTAYFRLYRPYNHTAPVSLHYAPQVTMTALVHGDGISDQIAATGFYEWELSREIAKLAKRGHRMVDVGANLGYFSLLWLAGNENNTVVSVEASPRNLPRLKKNILDNGFGERVRIESCAAGAKAGTLLFDLGPDDESGWGGFSEKGIEVSVHTLDELISDDDPIDVLKVDVEGADTWVLQGAERLLRNKQVRHIFFEQNEGRMQQLGIANGDAAAWLASLGYKVSTFHGAGEFTAVPN